MDSIDNGRWQFGVSAFYGRFILTALVPTAPPNPHGRFVWVFTSFRPLQRREIRPHSRIAINPTRIYSLWQAQHCRISRPLPIPVIFRATIGSLRAGASWRALMRPSAIAVTAMAKLCASESGTDPASRYGYDFTVGLNWRYANTGVFGANII